jgi:hypothetical protein
MVVGRSVPCKLNALQTIVDSGCIVIVSIGLEIRFSAIPDHI